MRQFFCLGLSKRIAAIAALPFVLFAYSAMAASSPKYIQGNYAVPQSKLTTVSVAYTTAQTTGNLNVVIVGWNDSTAQVSSVTDSNGNTYRLAVGPTALEGVVSQAIYYAKNIPAAAAGANTVKVVFNVAASYPDIRILEYSGLDTTNPLDVVAGATGTALACSSGSVTTTNAADLIVGATTVQTATTAAGIGFTQRMLTDPDGDFVEDRSVTANGSYSATATLLYPGGWVTQAVAFRAAGSPKPPPPLAYIQGNYAVPQSPVTSVPVSYTAAQNAGDLNVVIVGWNDSTSHVSSVTDTVGNVYQLAVGPTVLSGAVSQSIYYAKNIAAPTLATNTVTVKFNVAAGNPDIRILEYSGVDPVTAVDAVASATGTDTTTTSGNIATTNARDLLVGANTVQSMTAGPGSGYTERLLTDPDGDIAEDRIVTAPGSYSATAPLNGGGGSITQLVAFRAASTSSSPTPTPTPKPTPTPTPKPTPTPTPKPTPTPTPKPTPTPTPKPTPTPTPAPTPAPSLKLTWTANNATGVAATNTAGYRVYIGVVSGVYTQTISVGNTTSATVSNVTSGRSYYCVVAAYNGAGVEGPQSAEASYKVP